VGRDFRSFPLRALFFLALVTFMGSGVLVRVASSDIVDVSRSNDVGVCCRETGNDER